MTEDQGDWNVDTEGNLTPPGGDGLKPPTDEFGRDDPASLERERRRREREQRRSKSKKPRKAAAPPAQAPPAEAPPARTAAPPAAPPRQGAEENGQAAPRP